MFTTSADRAGDRRDHRGAPRALVVDRDDPAPSPAVAAAGCPRGPRCRHRADDTFVPEVPASSTTPIVVAATSGHRHRGADTVSNETGAAHVQNYESIQVVTPCLGSLRRRARASRSPTSTTANRSRASTRSACRSRSGSDMAIDINLFMKIADLVDAPIPVRISW
jgi:hypothetical protein